MVVDKDSIMNIMGGMENSVGVRLHNHRKKLRQRFDIRKKLGQGTYGKVQLGVNKETGQEVAIKTIRKAKIETEADLIRIRREIQIMSSVQHPNIIHIYEVFENREKIVLVMEYAAGGELYDFLAKRKVLDEDEARRIFRQIATAVYYCHKHKICHRDLKLENILLDEDGNAKIADFGLSNVFGGTRLMETYCGSPLYASPEIVLGIPYHGPEVDCWSLGVLLYTLVYGAMPFDGSHFKRLVKQISEADYFEPKTRSRASPLIAIMLTVSSKKRADIVRICKHWWVNEEQPDCCLDIAEHLASQTPVRLDLLLSLAPPVSSENVVVTKDMETNDVGGGAAHAEGPIRSHSVDSIMKVDQKDLPDFMVPKKKDADNHIGSGAKRDLTASSAAEGARASKRVARGRPSTKKKSTAEKYPEDSSEGFEGEPLQRSESKEDTLAAAAKILAAAAELATETATAEAAAAPAEKVKPDAEPSAFVPPAEGPAEGSVEGPVEGSDNSSPSEPSVEEIKNDVNGEVQEASSTGVVSIASSSTAPPTAFADKADSTIVEESTKTSEAEESAVPPTKPTERRKSKIFETAEKFNNLAESKTAPEKNRKVFIPGVKVSDAKAAFERKSSLTPAVEKKEAKPEAKPEPKPESTPEQGDSDQAKRELENRKKVKDAVDIIGRKLSLKKKLPPLVTNLSDSGSVGSPGSPGSPSAVDPATGMKTVRVQVAPNDIRLATIQVATPQATKFGTESPLVTDEPRKSSKVEITLKSATLPRRKTSQPEVPPAPAPAPVKAPSPDRNMSVPRRASVGQSVPSYRSEVEHMVGGVDHPNRPRHQRSEVSFPVAAAGSGARIHPSTVRSASLEPESKLRSRPREHIIPIRLEDDASLKPTTSAPAPARPPVPPGSSSSTHLPYQRSLSARSTSLSRQSTQDSDTDSTVSASGGEPIRKSQREYIIPIAVEGGGYVTPRASSLEPGEDWSKTSGHSLPRSRLSRPKRMSSLFSESDDERESLNSDERRSRGMDLHRLRSSRPTRRTLEHTDSLSSAEEEDDDEGFEILTAENLFSSLLSRVRSLTQRLNVEDGGRPGFPASRLLNQLHGSRAGSPFWTGSVFNRTPLEPLSRNTGLTTIRTVTRTTTRVSEATRSLSQDAENSGPTPWRRSVSRDTSDTESVASGTIPRARVRVNVHVPGRHFGGHAGGGGSGPSSPSWAAGGTGRRAELCNSGDFSEASYAYSPSVSECLSAPASRRSSRDSATSRRYTGGFSSARRAAKALEEELNQPASYNRRLGRTLSMRSPLDPQEKELPPLPYVPKRLSGYSSGTRNNSDGMTMSCPASSFSSREESVRSPSLLRSTSLSRDREERSERPVFSRYSDRRASAGLSSTLDRLSSGITSDRLSDRISTGLSSDRLSDRLSSGFSSDRMSSVFSSGLTSDRLSCMLTSDRLTSGITSDRLSSDRLGPERVTERPTLERFLSERPVTESSTLGRQSKGRRISRFLRPDFYDTPRESSIYAKERDLMKDSKQETETAGSRYGQSLDGIGQSRIESTIRSLRESSLGPKELDGAPTESSLLRRAVSVSDFTPNVKLAGYGDSSVPRRIPSYRKYTGTTSDTSLLLDGSSTNPPPSGSISKITSSATPLRKKRLSSKGVPSSVGKKRPTASPTNILNDAKVVSDTAVPDRTENKTDGRSALTDFQLVSKSLGPENNEGVSKSEGSPTKVSKIRGSTSSLSGTGLSKVRSPSKKSGSTTDLSSVTMTKNGCKIGASTSDLSAVNGSTKDLSTTDLSSISSSEQRAADIKKEQSSGNNTGITANMSEVNKPVVSVKTTKERSSLKSSSSVAALAAVNTEDSSATKVSKEESSVKNDSTGNVSVNTTSITKDAKEPISADTNKTVANLAAIGVTDSIVKKVPKVRSAVKSSASSASLTSVGTSELVACKTSKERGSIKTSGSKINLVTTDSLPSKVLKEQSPMKSSGSTTNLISVDSSGPITTRIAKERSSVKTSGSTTNLAAKDVADSSANKVSEERSSVKSSGSTSNVSGVGNVEIGASKVRKERSSIKISGSATNLATSGATDSSSSKRSSIKSSGSRSSLAAGDFSDPPSSKIASTKERSSVKSNGSATNLAGIDVASPKVCKEKSSSIKKGPSSHSSARTAEPTEREIDESKTKASLPPSKIAAASKEDSNSLESSAGTASRAESTTENYEASSAVSAPNSKESDSVKSSPESRVGKITKLRSSVKSSRSKTNISAPDASDSLSKVTKELSAIKTAPISTSNDDPANCVVKDSIPDKSNGSSSNLSSTNKVLKTAKSPPETTASPRRVRSITKMSDLSSSSLPKVPSLTRVSKNAEAPGKNDASSDSPPSPTKMRSVPKPSGSMTDISRTSTTKLRSLSKTGASTERLNTSPTKLRTVGTTKASGSWTDSANVLSKVPSASKLNRTGTESPRTVAKTSGSGPSPESTRKVARSLSGLIPAENTQISSDKVSVVVTPSVSPKKTTKLSSRKSESDKKINGTLRAVRSSTESPSVSPTKRLFSSLATSPIPGKSPPPMPGQMSPRPIHRRNSISQSVPSRRSSSHHRRGRSSSSVEPEDIPVISLKDVERRHRAMLLDRWSQSLQSLHLEREKAKAEAESKSEPKIELKQETKSEPKAEANLAPRSEAKVESIDEPKCEVVKSDSFKGRIPRLSSQSALNEASKPSSTPPKVPSCSSIESRPKTLSLKISPGTGGDTLLSPCESDILESPHSAVTSPASEDMESVSERIRRKSFYSRFNDVKKKKRSPSASASSLLPSYSLTSRTHYPIEYTRSLSCGISGPDKAKLLMPNGTGTSDDLRPIRKDRSPSWERSNMEIQNDFLFHNLGLHRFDPNNLSTDKETLLGMLSPTSEVAASALGASNSTSCVSTSETGESSAFPTKTVEAQPEPEIADVVVTLPPPKSAANKA